MLLLFLSVGRDQGQRRYVCGRHVGILQEGTQQDQTADTGAKQARDSNCGASVRTPISPRPFVSGLIRLCPSQDVLW
jgi:hypothetical protein